MPYTPVTWVDGVTPLNAAKLNQMEDGVEGAHADIATLTTSDAAKVSKDAVEIATARLVAAKLAAGDANQSFKIRGDGMIEWGAGGATALDTNLYRSGSNTLKTDDWLYVVGQILVGSADVNLYRTVANRLTSDDKFDPASLNLQTKAGAPVDGDIVGTVQDGDIVLDTTNHHLYVRSGGVWKRVSLETTYPGAKAQQATPQTLTNNVLAAMTNLGTVNYDDTGSIVSGGTMVIPEAGRYILGCYLVFAANATGARSYFLNVDAVGLVTMRQQAPATGSTRLLGETVHQCTAGQIVQVQAIQDSGADLAVSEYKLWVQRIK